jgi:hypothetical protein
MGLTLYLDRCLWPNGKEEILLPGDDRLKSLVSITDIDIPVMSAMLAVDQQLSRPLNDLIQAITWPNAAAISCARAIEGLRRHMNPDEGDNRGKSWGRFQEQLNISQAFRKSITEISTQPRHGNATFIPSKDTEDAIMKSWIIMNRYLHYLALGKRQLDPNIFEFL